MIGSLSFGLVQKINSYYQQSLPGSDGKLIEMTISTSDYEKFRVNGREIVINEVYFDVREAVSANDNQVHLVLKQDKFETFLVFTSTLLKNSTGKKQNKISDFRLPEMATPCTFQYPTLTVLLRGRTNNFAYRGELLSAHKSSPGKPPEILA